MENAFNNSTDWYLNTLNIKFSFIYKCHEICKLLSICKINKIIFTIFGAEDLYSSLKIYTEAKS